MSESQPVAAVAVLAEESRRIMYDYIRRQAHPVTRDEAAAQAGISRKLAAFHLEKLVEAGLLHAEQQAPPTGARRGPGRVPKVYRPTDTELSVSIPERRLDLLGEVLVDALAAEAATGTARDAALLGARQRGIELGTAERTERRLNRTGAERAIHLACGVLERIGYEPYSDDDRSVRMRNCPFHPLAARQRDLVCGMNRELIDGLLRGLGNSTVDATLAPRPGECCVELHQ
ncbi:MAG: helix-turn-helix transcriptional regulator [Pseudonocardiaceae bacterium]